MTSVAPWNAKARASVPLDGGGALVGDRVQVFIEIEAVLNPPQPGNA